MGRPAYQITQKDFTAARQYILNAIKREDISGVRGWPLLRNADTPELLQQWCNEYLQDYVFNRLKNAVIAARKHERDYKRNPKVGIDLSHTVHQQLASTADELGLTLSDTVIELIQTYWQAKAAELQTLRRVRDENEITYTSSAGYLLIVFIMKTGV